MRTTIRKNTHAKSGHSVSSFIQKKGDANFLASNGKEDAFIHPKITSTPALMRKCDSCAENEQVQQSEEIDQSEQLSPVQDSSIQLTALNPKPAEIHPINSDAQGIKANNQISSNQVNIQKTEDDSLALCPRYWRWETPRNIETYNCAGLAHRTYDYKLLPETRQALSAGRAGSTGVAGEVKHWLWTYNLHGEIPATGQRGPARPDFHTVAGVISPSGDPTDVYSKNGKRYIEGPGTGPSFRPPEREQDRHNNAAGDLKFDPAGNPIYKVRTGIREETFILPCNP